MASLDLFTKKRLIRFTDEFRDKTGQLPTLNDFEQAGFERELIKTATKDQVLDQVYVTLTNGTVVKGYKVFFK